VAGRVAAGANRLCWFLAALAAEGRGSRCSHPAASGMACPRAAAAWCSTVHQSIRDDGWTLFGFGSAPRAYLFRLLVAVRWRWPQMALGVGGHATRSWFWAIGSGRPCACSPPPAWPNALLSACLLSCRSSCAGLRSRAPRPRRWMAPDAPGARRQQRQRPGPSHPRRRAEIPLAALGYDALEINGLAAGRGPAGAGATLGAGTPG